MDNRIPFGALFINEWIKIWNRKRRLAIWATLVIVLIMVALAWQSQRQNFNSQQQQVAGLTQEISSLRQAMNAAPKKVRPSMRMQIQQLEQQLNSLKQNGGAIPSDSAQLSSLQSSLSQEPSFQRGGTLEQIAVIKYDQAHGILFNSGGDGGWRLVGQAFGSSAAIIYALLTVGLVGDSVAGEREQGTIAFLFLHTGSRPKAYLAKMAAAIAMVWSVVAAGAAATLLLGGLALGWGNPLGGQAVAVKVGEAALSNTHEVFPAVQVFHIIPQWSYDVLAVVLTMASLALVTSVLVAISRLFKSPTVSVIIGIVVVLSGMLVRLAGAVGMVDPMAYYPLLADFNGQLAQQNNSIANSLINGALVFALWALAATVYGAETFGKIEP